MLPTSLLRKWILGQKRIVADFRNFGVIMQHPLLCNIGVGITKLVLLVDPNLVVLLVMVEVGWVLGPPTSPPIKFIFVLMVVVGFLGHLRLILQHIPCRHLRFIV